MVVMKDEISPRGESARNGGQGEDDNRALTHAARGLLSGQESPEPTDNRELTHAAQGQAARMAGREAEPRGTGGGGTGDGTLAAAEAPARRKRGRPRKNNPENAVALRKWAAEIDHEEATRKDGEEPQGQGRTGHGLTPEAQWPLAGREDTKPTDNRALTHAAQGPLAGQEDAKPADSHGLTPEARGQAGRKAGVTEETPGRGVGGTGEGTESGERSYTKEDNRAALLRQIDEIEEAYLAGKITYKDKSAQQYAIRFRLQDKFDMDASGDERRVIVVPQKHDCVCPYTHRECSYMPSKEACMKYYDLIERPRT